MFIDATYLNIIVNHRDYRMSLRMSTEYDVIYIYLKLIYGNYVSLFQLS